ncbi:MAG: hypothetical protein BroJett041_23790 [Candidatus Jettenia caeni]|nr:MAG: hypothetical protein BroJett041_23790 [Candidatus Jettenia caeni]
MIKTQNLYALLDIEPLFILSALVFLAYAFYKIFLSEISEERHKSLRAQFQNLLKHYGLLMIFFLSYELLRQATTPEFSLDRFVPYAGLLSFVWGIIVFVKTSRMIILQYLFLGSMRTGVPLLIVNIFTLLLMVFLLLWGAAHIFGVQLAPLLATSAAFSIILGLALQDTLGNLFAGISLQLDKSFEIGDWLEVTTSGQKTVGQVKELTWRATTLLGWSDEIIIIPNRTLANSQISNFHSGNTPLVRSQSFRLAYGVNAELVRQCLIQAASEIPQVRDYPQPNCVISEGTDSWLNFKVTYYIDNYGSQFTVGDQVLEKGLQYLKANGIHPVPQTIQVKNIENK